MYACALAWWRDDLARARADLEECTQLIESGATEVVYGEVLELLARVNAEAGDLSGGLRALRRSYSDAVARVYRSSIASNLFYLTEMLGLAEIELETVAILHGSVARGPLHAMFPTIAGPEAARNERAIGNARAALGTERFNELSAIGASMNEDECIEFATSVLDRLVDETAGE